MCSMGRKIVCPNCSTVFDEEILRQKNSEDTCLVCGKSLSDDFGTVIEQQVEKTNYYYYDDGSATLTRTLYNHSKPLYTFEAVDMEDAERQLKEVLPNSPLFNQKLNSKVQCPYCFSTEVQMVPKKFSLLTGFATNRYNRVCIRCQRKF